MKPGRWHTVEIRSKEDLVPLVEVYRERVRQCAIDGGAPVSEYPKWERLPDDLQKIWVFAFLRAIKTPEVWGVVYPGEPEPTGEPDHGAGAADAATVRAGTGRVYRRRKRH